MVRRRGRRGTRLRPFQDLVGTALHCMKNKREKAGVSCAGCLQDGAKCHHQLPLVAVGVTRVHVNL